MEHFFLVGNTSFNVAVNRAEADIKGGIGNFRKRLWVSLQTCSKRLSSLVIFENGTVNHNRSINEVLPVALKYGNRIFGNEWTFQQDGAKAHFHEKTPSTMFLCSHWPRNSPDLNLLDYWLWDEHGIE